MISIIDYGAGNLRSVQKAFKYLGFKAEITSNPEKIIDSEKVILPGVGAFGECMTSIKKLNLCDSIKEVIDKGTPFLGICLGLQLLFKSSEESPDIDGLNIFDGDIIKIPQKTNLKIPHMGWNLIEYDKTCPIFKDLGEKPYVYFVHSYYMNPTDKDIISATTSYGSVLPIALHKNNVFATQFHPEKSGDTGLKILKNFAEL